MLKSQSRVGFAFSLYIASAVCIFWSGAVVLIHDWLAPDHPGHSSAYSFSSGGTVVCMVLGVALLATLFQRRVVAWATLFCLLALAVYSLLEEFLGGGQLGLNTLPLNSSLALSLLFVVAACASAHRKRLRRTVCLVAGLCVLGLSALSFISFWFDAPSWFTQTRFEGGALSLSPIGMLIGGAITQLPTLLPRVRALPRKPLLIMAVIGLFVTAISWHGVDSQQARKRNIQQELTLSTVTHSVEAWFSRQKALIGRVAERWEALPSGSEEALWRTETESYFRDLDGLEGMATVNSNMQLTRVAAKAPDAEKRFEAAMSDHEFRAWLTHVSDSQQNHVSPFELIDGKLNHLFVVAPITATAASSKDAFILALIDPEEGIRNLMADNALFGKIRVAADGQTLFKVVPASVQSQSPKDMQRAPMTDIVALNDFVVEVIAGARPHSRADWDTYLPAVILLSGFSLTLLLMVSRFFAYSLGRQELRLRKAHKKLTATLQLERQLRTTKTSFERYSQDLICTIDENDRFLTISPVCIEMLGYQPEEMLGHRFQEFMIEEDHQKTQKKREEVLAGRRAYNFRTRYRRKDGEIAVLIWSVEWFEAEKTFFCVARDVSATEEAERLRAERETFFALSPEMFCIVGTNTRFYQANRAFMQKVGFSLEELQQFSYTELFAQEDLAELEGVLAKLAAGEEVANQVLRVKTKQGQWLWFEFSAVQRSGLVYCAARDVSDVRETQQQLIASQRLLKIAEDTANIGGWNVDFLTGDVRWSDAVCRIHEVPIGTKPTLDEALNFYIPSFRDEIEAMVDQAVLTGAPFDGEFQIRTAKGRLRWVRSMGVVVKNDRGETVEVQGAFMDITESRMANDKIKALADRLQTTFESITDAFFTLDAEWRFTFLNSRAEQLLMRTNAELVGQNVWREFPGAVGTKFDECYHQAVETQQTVIFEAFYAPLNDWFEVSAYPSDGGLAVYFRSIRYRKDADARLANAVVELERSNSELEAFAYVSSHDLQEPLRKIQAFSDRMMQTSDNLTERDRDYLQRMQGAARRMQTLIRSLLEYSRVNTRRTPFAVVDLSLVLDEAQKDLEIAIDEANAKVTVGKLPEVEGDHGQLKQLFQNLLSNSLKFRSAAQTPEIVIGCVSETDERLTIEVRDNGVGFDQRHASRVFEPFHRLHHRDQFNGTGIGLAIVKKILDRHAADVEVESETSVGTTFRLTFNKSQSTLMKTDKRS